MSKLNYNSNNSGGHWWLTDSDWKKLEANGWIVEWVKDDPDHKGSIRWLGALATRASKEFHSPDVGISEFEKITGQDAWEEGCNCCGRPHEFTYTDDEGVEHWPNIQRTSTMVGWS